MNPAKIRSINLRPGVMNKSLWQTEERKTSLPEKTRKTVLTRDNFTCAGCSHRALKWMHIHHIEDGDDDDPNNLCTLCVACHAVMHMGRNLGLGTIEIWKSPISQAEIIHATREGIRHGLSLSEINTSFKLKRGRLPPASMEWANQLLAEMGSEPRAELPRPLCAVFVNFKQWQI